MNANELVRSIELEVSDAEEREETARSELNNMLSAAQSGNRGVLSAGESARSDALFRDIENSRSARRRSQARLARARDVLADEDRINAQTSQSRSTSAAPPAYDEVWRVGAEQRQYGRHNDPQATGQLFLGDVIASQIHGDPEATQRLARHRQEQRVELGQYAQRAAGDATSTTAGGISAPAYLVELTGEAAAAMRPVANMCVSHPLPPVGMTVIVPSITTATSAAVQSTQLTAVSTTSIGESDITLNVKTVAGNRMCQGRRQTGRLSTNSLCGIFLTVIIRRKTVCLINEATSGLSAQAVGTLGRFTATPRPARCFILSCSLPRLGLRRHVLTSPLLPMRLCIAVVGIGWLRK